MIRVLQILQKGCKEIYSFIPKNFDLNHTKNTYSQHVQQKYLNIFKFNVKSHIN